ncbi:MAG TPA: hypothetical protein VJS90_19950 [Pseudomonas sp.]|uniref:hypothetical protein n=1 Tax=Pseudomonas sp. TaxID=306 RepID=UPI002B486986|nr:hypothetical protein [Pseudomonas sp.]HKS15310.1 hypothetical protein [Pseudomonas sp.]
MRLAILAALLLAGLQPVLAAELQPRSIGPVPGAPGTATPTPYPQITPVTPPRAGDSKPGAPLLPPIPVPGPPRDQPLPGLQQEQAKPRPRVDR